VAQRSYFSCSELALLLQTAHWYESVLGPYRPGACARRSIRGGGAAYVASSTSEARFSAGAPAMGDKAPHCGREGGWLTLRTFRHDASSKRYRALEPGRQAGRVQGFGNHRQVDLFLGSTVSIFLTMSFASSLTSFQCDFGNEYSPLVIISNCSEGERSVTGLGFSNLSNPSHWIKERGESTIQCFITCVRCRDIAQG